MIMATQASVATQAVATQANGNSDRWQLRSVATQAGGNSGRWQQGQDIMNIELTLIKMQGYKQKKGEGKYLQMMTVWVKMWEIF